MGEWSEREVMYVAYAGEKPTIIQFECCHESVKIQLNVNVFLESFFNIPLLYLVESFKLFLNFSCFNSFFMTVRWEG